MDVIWQSKAYNTSITELTMGNTQLCLHYEHLYTLLLQKKTCQIAILPTSLYHMTDARWHGYTTHQPAFLSAARATLKTGTAHSEIEYM